MNSTPIGPHNFNYSVHISTLHTILYAVQKAGNLLPTLQSLLTDISFYNQYFEINVNQAVIPSTTGQQPYLLRSDFFKLHDKLQRTIHEYE